MRYYYAEIDSSGSCTGVLDTHEAIVSTTMIQLASFDASMVGQYWNGASFEVVAPPVVPAVRHVTVLAFLNRFTQAERISADLASIDSPSSTLSQRQQAAALRDDMARTKAAVYIDLDRADTRTGVQLLETVGLIAAGRAAIILDGPIQPHERYERGL